MLPAWAIAQPAPATDQVDAVQMDDVQQTEPPKIPEPSALMDSSSDLPLFTKVIVEDQSGDFGTAVRIEWLLAESPPVALFGDDPIPDSGRFGDWIITKTSESELVCQEGSKKKEEPSDISNYSIEPATHAGLAVKILRARSHDGVVAEPFVLVGTVPLSGKVEKREVRFNEGAKQVYSKSEKLRFDTPGERKIRNQFWQSYVDEGVEWNTEYFYRLVTTSGDRLAYNYATRGSLVAENRMSYEKITDFGPVRGILDMLPSDKQALEALRSRVASSVQEPLNVDAIDNPSDSGGAVKIEWLPSSEDLDIRPRTLQEKSDSPNPVVGYDVFRTEMKNGKPGDFYKIESVGAGLSQSELDDQQFKDVKAKSMVDSKTPAKSWDAEKCAWYTPSFSYIVGARTAQGFSFSKPSAGVVSKTQWFDRQRTMFLIIALIISVAIVWFIQHIRSGKKLFVRKIAGLEAIDEAIGRATEMGRPILFIPGIQDMNDVQTVSAVIILGRIAKTIAEYETRLMVPTSRSLVMTTARETVKEAYLSAGRPDSYNDDMITYLTDEQFGYVAGVNGLMVREKPATCFFLGAFFAESLILAETGNHIGAIQIAGTAMPAQLPFFIAACDYTLIGEELFAASAYLSHDPMQLGSLKGQDVGKLIAMLAIFIGATLATVAEITGTTAMQQLFEFFKDLFAVT